MINYVPFTCDKSKMITSTVVSLYFETIKDVHTMKKSTPTINGLDMICYKFVQRFQTGDTMNFLIILCLQVY